MSSTVRIVMLGSLLAACAGGAGPGSVKGRTAENTPGRFEADSNFARIAPEDTLPGSGCLSPMTDKRDGSKLIMRRAEKGVGDYEAPVGMYGVRNGELLRLNCNTGEVLGIVRR